MPPNGAPAERSVRSRKRAPSLAVRPHGLPVPIHDSVSLNVVHPVIAVEPTGRLIVALPGGAKLPFSKLPLTSRLASAVLLPIAASAMTSARRDEGGILVSMVLLLSTVEKFRQGAGVGVGGSVRRLFRAEPHHSRF